MLYLIYTIILSYLILNKFSINYSIDLLPNHTHTLIPLINDIFQFVNTYSYNIIFTYNDLNLFEDFTQLINLHTTGILLVLITFIIILLNVLNSLFFSNKIFILYNFLINLY